MKANVGHDTVDYDRTRDNRSETDGCEDGVDNEQQCFMHPTAMPVFGQGSGGRSSDEGASQKQDTMEDGEGKGCECGADVVGGVMMSRSPWGEAVFRCGGR